MLRLFVWILWLIQHAINNRFALSTLVEGDASAYSSSLRGAPARVALAVYQEVRTLPDNMISWKNYIIDPLVAAGSKVDMYLNLRLMEPWQADVVNKALELSNLSSHIVYKDFYNPQEGDAFIKDMKSLISTSENLHCYRETKCKGTPPEALFRQYFARIKIGDIISEQYAVHEYDLIIYLRSDLATRFNGDSNNEFFNATSYRSKSRLKDGPNSSILFEANINKSYIKLNLLDHLRFHNFSDKIAWIPEEENWLGGINDRMLILTGPAFIDYLSSIKWRLIDYITNGNVIHGESINRYMLERVGCQLRRIWLCYGVRRSISHQNCAWTKYGELACQRMGLEAVSLIFNDRWLLPSNDAKIECSPPSQNH